MALEIHLQSADDKGPLLYKFKLRGEVYVVASDGDEACLEAMRKVKPDNLELVEVRRLRKCIGYDKCPIYKEWASKPEIAIMMAYCGRLMCPFDYFGYCGHVQARESQPQGEAQY